MKITLRYLDSHLEVATDLLLHVEFTLDDGKTFRVGLDTIRNALNLHCDSQLIIYPEAANRVHFDMEVY